MNNFECMKDRCNCCAYLSDYDGEWYCEESDEPKRCEDVAKCHVGTIDPIFEGFKSTIKEIMKIDKYTLIQYKKGGFDEWCVCYDYDPITREWASGTYCFGQVQALAEMLSKVNPSYLKSKEERDCGIPYARMSEIASKCIDGLLEDDEEQAIEYLKKECDLSRDEAEYFGCKDKLFKKLYKIVEVTFTRREKATVKVAIPQDEDSYNADDYVDCRYNLEPDSDDYDWDYKDHDDWEEELTAEDIRERYDGEIWNWETFED